jgi:hypothetical protein
MKAEVDQKSGGVEGDLVDRSGAASSGVSRFDRAQPVVFQIYTIVDDHRRPCAGRQWRHRSFVLLSRTQGLLDRHRSSRQTAAADKIEEFITQIESQVGWTTQSALDRRHARSAPLDALRLLRQVPAVTELAQIDAAGHEQLKVSRLTMDVVDSGIDDSQKPKFTQGGYPPVERLKSGLKR